MTLRDYQQEGFCWLARLAQGGLGACLADDMGLGKTVQAIALLLNQHQQGPALVITPPSLCYYWASECSRLAPALDPKLYHLSKHDLLSTTPQKGLVMIVSYGVMHRKEVQQQLQQMTWHMVLLDEAQAIKNPNAKRTKGIWAIPASCKVVLTGTPIENHLTELWSLFRFINPGLLGSLNQFKSKFVSCTQDEENDEKRQTLKKLIQPYLLRRTKSQVLSELPDKTEQNILIELTPKETAFYEGIREKALENVNNLASHLNAGQRQQHYFRELTKIRQACCDPCFIDKRFTMPSAKTKAFVELIQSLVGAGHRALIFSQFVTYLKKIESQLIKHKISYQYLDGSTSKKQRQKRVDAFQKGEGQVFLISLNAGGTGLNLTAADSVVHLDPWWNPAKEDQASDRAHRIGQTNPVTVYRLILKATIEEKIIKLHDTKRQLAEDILSGQDNAKLSEQALLALLED